METSLEIWALDIWESENLNFFESLVYLTSSFVCSVGLRVFVEFSILEYDNMMKSWKVEDEESPGINFAGGISPKSWIWI